jgi:hypothetical protein
MVQTGTREKNGSTGKKGFGLDGTRRTGNRQTENTCINAHGIMGKMSNTWRGWKQAQDG